MIQPVLMREWGALALVALLIMVLRGAIAHRVFVTDFDTGTVGLMAMNILEGDRPLFFYGQNYMGALEAYLAAFLFSIWGASTTTLAMSAVLFSVAWMVATWMLLRELFGRALPAWVGLLLLAFPNWHTLWYSVATYGGYPGCYFFGTLAWWGMVRVNRHGTGRVARLCLFALSGFSAGLALWTNMQSAVLVLMAGLWGGWWLLCSPAKVSAKTALFGCALLPFLIGVAPVLATWGIPSSDLTAELATGKKVLWGNLRSLVLVSFPRLVLEPSVLPRPVIAFALLLVPLGIILNLLRLRRSADVRSANLLLFFIVYMALYLVHPMASMGAARYLILPWQFLVLYAFLPGPPPLHRATETLPLRTRLLPLALPAVFVLTTGAATFLAIQLRSEKRGEILARQMSIVDTAHTAELRVVDLVAGARVAHRGQSYTFLSGNRIQFLSTYDDRIQSRVETAERESAYGFFYQASDARRNRATLDDLDVTHARISTQDFGLAVNLEPRFRRMEAVIPSHTQVDGKQFSVDDCPLFDRKYSTAHTLPVGESGQVTLAFEQAFVPGMIWLTSPDPYLTALPTGYRLWGSLDGVEYSLLHEVGNRFAAAYRSGNRVYIMGFQPVMEIRPPLSSPIRFLRFEATSVPGDAVTWTANEIMVFAHRGPAVAPDVEDDMRAVAAALSGKSSFVVADRQCSAWLRHHGVLAFSRYNPKFHETTRSRIFALDGQTSVLLPFALQPELLRLASMSGVEAQMRIQAISGYLLVEFSGVANAAQWLWNGHFPLYAEDSSEPLWR